MCDNNRLCRIYKSLSDVLTHSVAEWTPSILIDYCRRAIVHSATVVNSGLLPSGTADKLSIEALNCAIDMIAWLMQWFDHFEAGENAECNRVAVTEVVEKLELIVVAVKPLVRCQVSLHSRLQPLISCLDALRTLLNTHHLALEGKVRQVALIEEVLAMVSSPTVSTSSGNWFDIRTFPKLTNGALKICSLNAGLGILWKFFPHIRQNLQPSKPLSRELGIVLNAEEQTSLVGVKKALNEYHDEPDYEEDSQGGIAAEAARHLIEDLGKECGSSFYSKSPRFT